MYKRHIITLLLISTFLFAKPHTNDECEKINNVFQQAGFLIKNFQDYRNAYYLLEHARVLYHFALPKEKQQLCIKTHFHLWLTLLYKNKKTYILKELHEKDKKNALISKYLGNIYREQSNPKKAIEYYNDYLKNTQSPKDKEILNYVKRGGLELYKSKWGINLNSSNEIPTNQFKNIFFDFETKKIIKTTQTPQIKIFAITKLFDYANTQLASYHVGKFIFSEEVKKKILFDCGHARECRLIIDNQIISKRTNHSITHLFSKGTHKIEIEYLNNDSMYNFNFSISPYIKPLKEDDLQKKYHQNNYPLWLVNYKGGYNSKMKNGALSLELKPHKIELTLKNSTSPIMLFLQSSGETEWHIHNTKNVKAIILGHHRGTPDTIHTDSPVKQIDYTYLSLESEEYPSSKKCICTPHTYLCLNDLIAFAPTIKKIFNTNIATYTYTTKPIFTAPETTINPHKLKEAMQKRSKAEKICLEKKLDKIFTDTKEHK